MKRTDFRLKNLICLALHFLCAFFVLFSKWVAFKNYNVTLPTLYRLYSLLRDSYVFSNIIMTSGVEIVLTILFAVLYGFLLMSIIVAWRSFSDSFHGYISDALFTWCIAMSIALIVLIGIANLTVNNAAKNMVENLFRVGSGAFFTLAVSILGKIIANRMPDVTLHELSVSAAKIFGTVSAPTVNNANVQTAQPQAQAAQQQPQSAPQPMRRFCPHCGKAVSSGMVFCPYCGGKLASEGSEP